jgi:hypothetical protein
MLGQPRVHIHLDDERVVPEKPKEEPIALPPKALNGLSVTVSPPVVAKDENDDWLESFTTEKTDEEKKNGDTVKP